MDKAIVTLSDSKYYPLLNELINSIKDNCQGDDIKICVLDAGLTNTQREKIKNKVYKIEKAKWDLNVSSIKALGKEWLKSQVSRAFLPKYFPEFKKLLWIDCDAWVQSKNSIDLYFDACQNGKLAITQSIGPGYKNLAKVKWFFNKYAAIKTQNYKHAKSSGFSEEIARKIAFAPHLNIGVFALENKSECWKIWQKNLKKSLSKGKIFGSEGLAINITTYVDNYDTEFLPIKNNFIASHVLPKYNEKTQRFVEPFKPNDQIGIMHLAGGIWVGGNDMRESKNLKISIKSLDGSSNLRSLRYLKINEQK